MQRWVRRAQDKRLDRVDFADRSCAPRRTRRVPADLERRVLEIRDHLRLCSDLGEFGDQAIHRHLREQGVASLPSVRTIARILARNGVLDGRRRVRRAPPPPGWYLPDLAARLVELDAFDVVEDLSLRDESRDVHCLNAVSLHGRLVNAWPRFDVTADFVLEALLTRWRQHGLPAYAQFDNDTRFQGPHNLPDALGRVIRLCLALDIAPVFAPPRETGFQAAIESFNGLWQRKVVHRFVPADLAELKERSERYVLASQRRHAPRNDSAPSRRLFPRSWSLNLQKHPAGRIVYLRRTNDRGVVDLLGHSFVADRRWVRRLVRAEVLLDENLIRFHALRRAEPTHQPILSEHTYHLPRRPFRDHSSRNPRR